MTRFTLEPVWADRPQGTQRILLGEAVVGHLYETDDIAEGWEIWPRDGCKEFFPGEWGQFRQKRVFDDRAAAEAYLGIRQDERAAA